MRTLKRFEPLVSLTDTFQEPGGPGWSFGEQGHVVPGTDRRVRWPHEFYAVADPACTTRDRPDVVGRQNAPDRLDLNQCIPTAIVV
jgi:hypothetical protein